MGALGTAFSNGDGHGVNGKSNGNGTAHAPLSPWAAAILHRLHGLNKRAHNAETGDWHKAVAQVMRSELLPVWEATKESYRHPSVKQAYYISIEWLLGPNSHTALHAVGAPDEIKSALKELGQIPEKVLNHEIDPGLGNGGLGRLAACFIDSGANLHLPVQGYGLMYDSGFFRQVINAHGHQEERPDNWADDGNPWGFEREDLSYNVNLFGHVKLKVTAHDMMVPSHDGRTVNTLRLWRAHVPDGFNSGNDEINEIVREINKTLYPEDDKDKGKNLRLAQEYVLVSASVQDIIRRHLEKHPDVENLSDSASIQINDTHPALAVPELMRALMDGHGLGWDEAKKITREVCNYTNHTLLGEALEKWPEGKIQYVVPRVTEIMKQLQVDLMAEVDRKFAPEDQMGAKDRISILHEENNGKGGKENFYRMGHLAAYHSRRVNGVSAMHTELVYEDLFPDLAKMRGADIKINHTNGISQRRFLRKANPELSGLITEALGGEEWITDLDRLEGLRAYQDDPAFLERFAEIKRNNKIALGRMLHQQTGITTNPDAMFDIQVKRFHDYKRQLMNLLNVTATYLDILDHPNADRTPIVSVMAGKAAPGYARAKKVIALANALAARINNDPQVRGQLVLGFPENYNVSKAEIIIPAADISQQISTAGYEASGTSNMKFTLNGALTLGTRDGANVEIGEAVGEDDIYFFGKTKDEVKAIKAQGYSPREYIQHDPRLLAALTFIQDHIRDSMGWDFRELTEYIWRDDSYLIAADFPDYGAKHRAAQALYLGDPGLWVRKAVRNTIAGRLFSSDRTLQSYNRHNWGLNPVVPESVHELEIAYLARNGAAHDERVIVPG